MDIVASLGYCAILAVVSLAFAEGVALVDLAPPVDALLACAPGGQAEMMVLAPVAGTDVASHHLVRLAAVIVGAPLMRSLV